MNNHLTSQANKSAAALTALYDYQILHVYRAGNKMADYLANIAMDEQHGSTASLPIDTGPHSASLHELLAIDLTHEPQPVKPQTNLLAAIKHALKIDPPPAPDAPTVTTTNRRKIAPQGTTS